MKHNLDHALVQDDLKEMKDILEKERQVGQGGWLECFNPKSSIPKLVWRTFLGFFIHFLQQWTGVNYFFYYGASIFESAGIEDPIQTQLILGAVNVATTFMGLWFVEKFGRRWPLFIGALWQAGWLRLYVHRIFRQYLGSHGLGRHRREFPSPYSCQAGFYCYSR
jgi:SP family sugar:H+ symporter-like MFS transporter